MATQLAGLCSSHLYLEKDYQNAWCSAYGGKTEVVLPDKARADCVTSKYAIEFDFAHKWAESIGQSLYYGEILGKQPGIVLIMEHGNADKKYLARVKEVADQHNITVWTVTPEMLHRYN